MPTGPEYWLENLRQLVEWIDTNDEALAPEVRPQVTSIRALAARAVDINAVRDVLLSMRQATQLSSVADQLLTLFAQLVAATEQDQRAQLYESLVVKRDSLRACVTPILIDNLAVLPYIIDNSFDHNLAVIAVAKDQALSQLAELRRDVESRVGALETLPTTALKEVQDALAGLREARGNMEREYEAGVATMQRALGEIGVGQYERYFAELEKRYAFEADAWLSRTGWALTVTIFVAFTYLVLALAKVEVIDFETVTAGGALVIVFSALASTTVFCARSYRSNHHRAAVNGHRAVALRTFVTFRDSATDDATRNAVLAMVAQLCFAGEDTGLGTNVDIVTPLQAVPKTAARD